ncbi:hypothetical protein ACJROX_21415 [Pseudalkalibacillus sp. A8]
MEDVGVAFVWIATVLATIGCIVFGTVMWNRGGDEQ